jgi:hypothetical protein
MFLNTISKWSLRMPDISALFFRLMEDKGALYVADKLEHSSTSIIDRWKREGEVPESKKWAVLELLKREGVIS